jgi:hypothetical protein
MSSRSLDPTRWSSESNSTAACQAEATPLHHETRQNSRSRPDRSSTDRQIWVLLGRRRREGGERRWGTPGVPQPLDLSHHDLQGLSPGRHNDRWRSIYDRLFASPLTCCSDTKPDAPRQAPCIAHSGRRRYPRWLAAADWQRLVPPSPGRVRQQWSVREQDVSSCNPFTSSPQACPEGLRETTPPAAARPNQALRVGVGSDG